MLKNKKIYLILILALAICYKGYPQKKELELGQAAFSDMQFIDASKYFQRANSKIEGETSEKYKAIYMLAECYRLMNEPGQAEPYYQQIITGSYCDTVPEAYLRYADLQRTKGDVAIAKENYQKYLKVKPESKDAKTGLASCEWILARQDKQAQVNLWQLEKVNSNEDDFAPAFLDPALDRIIFTSNRSGDKIKMTDQWTGSNFSDLLTTTYNGKEWAAAEPVDYQGVINSDVHEGAPALSGDFNTLYFTRCDLMAGKKVYCQLWFTRNLDTRWSTPRKVLSDSTGNIGQPAISKDELTLYFSSDRQGTTGGKDLWVVTRQSKDQPFGQPVNLGKSINTSDDEVFPYLYNDTTLYFSSNGHPGFGGWDIYRSAKRNNSWTSPEILQSPLNSGYDDFGVIILKPDEEGFLTSNRPGGKGGDDLYMFTRKVYLFSIKGNVKDNLSQSLLEGVKVRMTGDEGTVAESVTDRHGNYKFDNSQVLEDHTYKLFFSKDNYFAAKDSVSTFPYDSDHEFNLQTKLDPIPEKPIVLPDILYALDKWDLMPQYQDSLMQLVGLLKDNGNIVIELRSHTDSRGSDEYNEILSQKRAQTVVDFIISRGIDPRRLVAKGYGEKVFRVLDKDMVRENYLFKAGTELNDQFINGLPSEEIKEAAYQLNRRTEFSVLSKDFKP